MSEILQSRYDRLVRRVADLKGPGSKVNDVIEELLPVLEVENVPAELLILQGTYLALGSSRVGAVAAQFAQAMLRNPGGSGQIITLLEVHAWSDTGQEFGLGPTQNTLATAGLAARSDTREFPNGPTGQVLSESLLAAGPSFMRIRFVTEPRVVRPPKALAVIGPGTAFSVTNITANASLLVSFLWQERVAEGSELNL